MPDESTATAVPAAAPVVVTPIKSSQSRIIWLSKVMMLAGAALEAFPELVSDPLVRSFINETMSPGARRIIGVVTVALGIYLRFLRRDTSAPIIGTNAAQNLPTVNEAKENTV